MSVRKYKVYICDRCEKEIEVSDTWESPLVSVRLYVGNMKRLEKGLCKDCIEDLGLRESKTIFEKIGRFIKEVIG